MRALSEKGLKKLKELEGLSLTPYRDSGKKWTIGWGHLLPDTIDPHFTITRERAEQLLRLDVARAEGAVNRFVSVPLSQGQFDALVLFTYNEGVGAFEESTLLVRVNDQKFDTVPYEFARWHFADGISVPGLVKRRLAEIALWKDSDGVR